MVLATCISPKIQNPFNEEEDFDKEQLGLLVVFIDILTVVCIFLFAEALNNTQEEYAAIFHSQTIEMTDFTIRVKNLPHHTLYGDKDDVLRAVLTAHFQEIVKDEIKLIQQQEKEDDGPNGDFSNLAAVDVSKDSNEVNPQDYEVTDINFGKADMKDMELMTKMSTMQNEYTRNYIRKLMFKDGAGDARVAKIDQQQAKLNSDFVKVRDLYVEEKKRRLAAIESGAVSKSSDSSVRYAYITFRSKEAVELVKRSYSRYGKCTRCCVMCCCKSQCKKQRAELEKKHIFKNYPVITESCQPDNINWQNLGYGNAYRQLMVACNWLIAIIMIAISLAFIVWLKQETIRLKKEYNIDVNCPADSGSGDFKEIAWTDQQLN